MKDSELYWTLVAGGLTAGNALSLVGNGAKPLHVVGLTLLAICLGSRLTIWWPRPERKP